MSNDFFILLRHRLDELVCVGLTCPFLCHCQLHSHEAVGPGNVVTVVLKPNNVARVYISNN